MVPQRIHGRDEDDDEHHISEMISTITSISLVFGFGFDARDARHYVFDAGTVLWYGTCNGVVK